MDEKEMVLNILDSVSLALCIDDNKEQFIMNEGINIMLECLKKKEFFSKSCYGVIESGLINNAKGCKFFIDAKGLKLLFPIFMHKALKEKNPDEQRTLDDHSIAILFNLCLYLDDIEFLRLVAKFKENNYEKFDRLITYHEKYIVAVEKVEANKEEFARMLEIQDQDELESELYRKKMEEGQLSLFMADFIIALLSTSDSLVKDYFDVKYKKGGFFMDVSRN